MITSITNLIVAHRGESFNAPENTLESVILAWKNKVKNVEIDIHLTKDNQIVVIHDKDTQRTSGQKKIIAETNFSELINLDVAYLSKSLKNIKIPLLKDVLVTVPKYGKLIIEIKSGKKIIPFLSDLLNKEEYKKVQVEIISFDYGVITIAKKEFPHIKCLWLLDLDYYWWNFIVGIRSKKLIEKLTKSKLDGANLYAGKIANRKFVETLIKNKFIVYVWTVNEPSIAYKYIEFGVTGITTDKPSWMINELNQNYYKSLKG